MGLPEHGLPAAEVIAKLQAKRARDARWQDGRTFGMVYDGGPEVHEVARAAAEMFLHENALNTRAFPSLGRDPVRGRRRDGRAVPRPADAPPAS